MNEDALRADLVAIAAKYASSIDGRTFQRIAIEAAEAYFDDCPAVIDCEEFAAALEHAFDGQRLSVPARDEA